MDGTKMTRYWDGRIEKVARQSCKAKEMDKWRVERSAQKSLPKVMDEGRVKWSTQK